MIDEGSESEIEEVADNPISSEMDYTEQDTLEPSLAI